MNIKQLIAKADAETINKAAAQIIKDIGESPTGEFIIRTSESTVERVKRALAARRNREPKILIDTNGMPGKGGKS